jgi:hypothetical protein
VVHQRAKGMDTRAGACHHFTLSAQYAGDILPRAMLLACLALNDARLALSAADSPLRAGLPLTPCWLAPHAIWSDALASASVCCSRQIVRRGK